MCEHAYRALEKGELASPATRNIVRNSSLSLACPHYARQLSHLCSSRNALISVSCAALRLFILLMDLTIGNDGVFQKNDGTVRETDLLLEGTRCDSGEKCGWGSHGWDLQ